MLYLHSGGGKIVYRAVCFPFFVILLISFIAHAEDSDPASVKETKFGDMMFRIDLNVAGVVRHEEEINTLDPAAFKPGIQRLDQIMLSIQ